MNWYKKSESEEKLYIHFPDGLHTWGICFQSQDQDELERFVSFCRTELDKKLGAFHQSGSKHPFQEEFPDFQFFEFLIGKGEDLILKECEKVSEYMRMPLT